MTDHATPNPLYPPDRCPLCGQPNACAMEVQKTTGLEQPPCWCLTMGFTPALLASVPAAARHSACICAACAQRAKPVNADAAVAEKTSP